MEITERRKNSHSECNTSQDISPKSFLSSYFPINSSRCELARIKQLFGLINGYFGEISFNKFTNLFSFKNASERVLRWKKITHVLNRVYGSSSETIRTFLYFFTCFSLGFSALGGKFIEII